MSTTRRKNVATGQLQSFLSSYRVERGSDFTHTSLGKPMGSFYIPVDMLNAFYTLYIEAFESDMDLYITEKHRHISPVLIDFDFRFPLDAEGSMARRYNRTDILKSVELYVKHLRMFLDIKDDFDVFILEKTAPVQHNGLVKDGVHVMIPNVVTRPSVQHLVRQKVLAEIASVWDHLQLANSYSNAIDESVIDRNNWLMYGSKKPNGEAYRITEVLKCKRETGDLELQEKNLEESEYIEILSIRNKYVETEIKIDRLAEIQHYEKLLESKRQRMVFSKNIFSDEEDARPNTYDNIELVRKLIELLDKAHRSDDYHKWIRLGWCLRNIDHRLLPEWEAISRASSKYVEGECGQLWRHMRLGGLGIGTLHMWAKEDNLEGYREVIRHDLKTQIERSYRNGITHYDVARVVYEMYRHDFVCASIKNRFWYEFRDHRWNATDMGHSLRANLSTEVCQEYIAEAIRLQRLIASAPNERELKDLSENVRKCNDIVLKLKMSAFKDNIMKEASEMFYVEKFEEKLDSNTNIMGFTNGVYDLDAQEFRQGHPEDYISFTTGIRFVEYNPLHPHVRSIMTYLEQVLPKPHIREYVMKLFASFLNGTIKEQKFHIWTGSGSNSKSKLVELFERSFGDYCCKFPITMLTQKRLASNAANAELARAKGKRFACLQEPSEDEKISVGQLKEYSGGDKIIARALYKEPVEFTPQFKMLLLCNHLPHVPSDDGGTWRRIRVVEFTSKFVEDPKEENEFPIDFELSSKMEQWKEHFMAMLIETYKKYNKDGIKEPDEVMACTRDYKRQNDHLGDFIHNCLELSPNGFLTLNDAFNELRTWLKDDNIPMKAPTKQELEKYLGKNLVKLSTMGNGIKGFKGVRVRNRYAAVEQDAIDA